MILRILGAIGALFLVALVAAIAWLYLLGPWRSVDMHAQAPTPQPPVLEAPADAGAWRQERARLLDAFEQHVYGAMPDAIAPIVTSRQIIAPANAGGINGVEQWTVELGAAGRFHLAIARPVSDAPAPVILVLDFCGNRAAFPGRPEAIAPPVGYIQSFCNNAGFDPIAEAVFGAHVNAPPFEAIQARGYAVALLYAGDVVPDEPGEARTALARFAPGDTGALMAWAWTASRALDVIAADPRFDANRIAVWGQSRQGKSALIAGAYDERFAAVVALQSGRGGDAPTRAFEGESVEEITRSYGHWFSPRYNTDAPVEQHQLLALIAPRALLVTHALRDSWADPIGARAVREAAAPVFDLLGAPAPQSFLRHGGHGIQPNDWDATLNFLDARMAR